MGLSSFVMANPSAIPTPIRVGPRTLSPFAIRPGVPGVAPLVVRITPEISCERSIGSTLVSFISLLCGSPLLAYFAVWPGFIAW